MTPLNQVGQNDPDYRRAIARAMMMQGLDTSPVQSWTQGAARLANALVGSMNMNAIKSQDSAAVNSVLDAALNPQYPATPAAPPQQSSGAEPRGIRNNNPLNIESGSFTQSQPGFAGSDGRFAKFQSPDQGVAAADALLQTYAQKHGLNTVGGIVNRWAPPADNNPTSTYASTVAKQMGVDPASPLNMSDPAIRQKMIAAMAQFENGKPLPNNGPMLAAPQRQEPTIPPNVAAAIRGALLSGSGQAQALGAQMLQKYMQPQEYGFQTLPDGTIVRTSKTTGDVAPVYGFNKPQLQTIKTPDGQEITAWVNPSDQTAKPVQIPGMSQGQATVTGPDGKQIAVPQGQNAKAFIQQVTKNSADAMSGKLTEEQAKSTQFANRMEEAEQNAQKFQGNYNNKRDAAAQWVGEHPLSPVPRAVANMATSEPYQKLQQAKSQFITALLRRESGAAINRDEFIRYDREFFPQVGDGPEVVAQKSQARKTAIEAMQKTAGPAYKSPQSVSGVRKFNPATGKIE